MAGTLNVLDIFEKSSEKIVYTSSSMAYGALHKQRNQRTLFLIRERVWRVTAGEYM